MRNNGKGGGMCSSAVHATLICPLCNKSAFRVDRAEVVIYSHFTDKGTMQHIDNLDGTWSRKRG